jgi:hypothetical protein
MSSMDSCPIECPIEIHEDFRPDCKCYHSKSDLLDWLSRRAPVEAGKSSSLVSADEHTYRHAGDAALVERGRELTAKGMSKSRAAKVFERLVGRRVGERVEANSQGLGFLVVIAHPPAAL